MSNEYPPLPDRYAEIEIGATVTHAQVSGEHQVLTMPYPYMLDWGVKLEGFSEPVPCSLLTVIGVNENRHFLPVDTPQLPAGDARVAEAATPGAEDLNFQIQDYNLGTAWNEWVKRATESQLEAAAKMKKLMIPDKLTTEAEHDPRLFDIQLAFLNRELWNCRRFHVISGIEEIELNYIDLLYEEKHMSILLDRLESPAQMGMAPKYCIWGWMRPTDDLLSADQALAEFKTSGAFLHDWLQENRYRFNEPGITRHLRQEVGKLRKLDERREKEGADLAHFQAHMLQRIADKANEKAGWFECHAQYLMTLALGQLGQAVQAYEAGDYPLAQIKLADAGNFMAMSHGNINRLVKNGTTNSNEKSQLEQMMLKSKIPAAAFAGLALSHDGNVIEGQ